MSSALLHDQSFRRRLRRRRWQSQGVAALSFSAILLSLAVVATLLYIVFANAKLLVPMRAAADAGLVVQLFPIQWNTEIYRYLMIADILAETPVERAGLERYDALIRVGSHVVRRPYDLWNAIDRLPPGERRVSIGWVPVPERLFGDLSKAPTADRLILDYLLPDSPAARAGLQVGDAILRVDKFDVSTLKRFEEALILAAQGRARPEPLILEVERHGTRLQIPVEIEQRAEIPIAREWWRAIWSFLTTIERPQLAELSGLVSALVGTAWIVLLTGVFSLFLGVGAAIYLEEYAPRHGLTSLIQVLIANLAGVPSVIYGIIGLEILARQLQLGRILMAGALTMTLLILPLMIIAAREALRTIPDAIRQAAYAVGATRWQVIRHHVLPYALPGILTGAILSLSRAAGEAALLIMLGAFQYIAFIPGPFDIFSVIPIQIFEWVTLPQDGFVNIAAAAILVLLSMLLSANALAIFLRTKFQRRW